MVHPWQRVAKQRVTQTFSSESVISFTPLGEEDRTEGPMIIEAEMGGHFVHRMYVDRGTFLEILFEHCFNRFRPEVNSQMVPAATPLRVVVDWSLWYTYILGVEEGSALLNYNGVTDRFMARRAEDIVERMRKDECKITNDIFLVMCRAYRRVHKPHDVMRIFQKMKEYECEPTLKAYITVFSILVDENQLKVALKFYRYMRQLGFPPNVSSLNVLIKALLKNSGTMDLAIQIFHEMPNHGCIPDTYTYGTLINGLCRLGKISKARKLLKEMEAKGCSPSVVTYTSLIHRLCQLNYLDEAKALLQEMEAKSIIANVYTYLLFGHCGLCKNEHSSEAIELLEVMISKRHKPNMVTYSTLLHGLFSDGYTPGEDTWKELECRVWGKQKAQDAADLMSEVLSGN
ncbi:pentatricopeptide repeat-containing protein [Tanacetum coccineum]